jgi:hypothetical protein
MRERDAVIDITAVIEREKAALAAAIAAFVPCVGFTTPLRIPARKAR